MLIPMTRLQVIGHKRDLDKTLQAVQVLACVQLIDGQQVHTELRPYALADEQRELETLSYLLARLDALLALLPRLPEEHPIPWVETDLCAGLQADLDRHAPTIEELARRREALRNDAEILPSYAETVRKLLRLTPELTKLQGYETIALLVQRRYSPAIELLAEEVEAIAGQEYELVYDQVDPDRIGAILVVPQRVAGQVQALLGQVQVSQVRLPESLQDVPFQDALGRIQRRLEGIPGELEQVDVQLQQAAERHRRRWLGARHALARRLEQLRARRHLGETDHAFVLIGWVPQRELVPVVAALENRLPDQLAIQELPPSQEEASTAPVLLENQSVARPYEFFIRLLALPRAGSLDPTAWMALFMPLFFGLMLGDIGYGLVILLIAAFVHYRSDKGSSLRDVTAFLMMGAGWSIVWGLVFGEFFGSLGHALGLQPLWLERSSPDALAPLLIFALAIGAVHVTLGLVLGVWSAWCAHHTDKLWERAGMLVGLCGLFLLAGVAAQQLPSGWTTPGLVVVLVGLVLLIRGMGPLGALMAPVELLGVVGNILSYLRLAAIGLASVYLALVGNEMASRVGVVWVGVIIALLFHALNIALGAFSPSIHALRLHYVEFFSKFYEDGGKPFQPFGLASTEPDIGQPGTAAAAQVPGPTGSTGLSSL
ncbi:MAG: V-type ATPase 116kDa subunit family protein [Chloroflexota bacterium]|nr:V-type ATPase 116kDa subunit family protein [Chloroflexota bacterium]